MIETIEQICAETHNYFDTDRIIDTYEIENGIISLPFLVEGQFFRIVGSKFNDGVYVYTSTGIVRSASWNDVLKDNPNWAALTGVEWGKLEHQELIDETFRGGIWPMRMPRAVVELAKEIADYNASDAAKASPFTSESISGHYSYSKANVTDSAWQKVFAAKLNRYRKAANI